MRLKLTEKSYRGDFVAILRTRLENRGFVIIEEGSMISSDGSTIQIPDILIVKKEFLTIVDDTASIRKGGTAAVVETKKPKREASEGLGQAVQYAISLECKTGFTTNFRDIMGFRLGESPEIGREIYGTEPNLQSTTATVSYIVDVLEGRKSLVPTDRGEKEVISLLQGAVAEIEQYLNDVEPELLKDPLGLEAPSLNPVEGTSRKQQEQERKLKDIAVKKGAAYLVINQILFYNVLSAHKKEFPRLSNITTASELQRYFERVLEQDYRPVFGARVAPLLPNRSVEAINNIISAIQYLKLEELKQDVLGKIFHNLIPFEIRKRLAAYYTSNSAAEFLASLSIDNPNAVVIDFSCGSGTLLVAAYHAKKSLSSFNKNRGVVHRKLLKEIVGVDVQLFASHLAVIHLSLQEPFIETDEVQIAREDAFNLKPFQSAEFLGGAASRTRVRMHGVEEEQFIIPMADLLIQNPPFTRVERLRDYKTFLEKVLRHRKGYLRSGMGLHCHFILHSADFLKSGGRYCAVLPSATFNAKYGEGIRKFLLDSYNIEYFIASDAEATFSEGSNFKEVLIVARKNGKEDWKTKCVVLKKTLSLENFEMLANKIKQLDHDYSGDDFTMRLISKNDFGKEWNWMVFTKSETLKSVVAELIKSPQLTKGEFVITLKEGVHINSPKFFVLPNFKWDVENRSKTTLRIRNKDTNESLNIPLKFVSASLGKPEYNRLISPETNRFLVLIPPDDKLTDDIKEYIKWGQDNDLHKTPWINTYCKKNGIPWYAFMYHDAKTRKSKGKVVIIMKFRMKKRTCICHYFDEDVRGSNMYFFGSTENTDYDKVLAAWFNSTIFLAIFLFSRREISGDWAQVKIIDLKKYPCIEPRKLNKDAIKTISSILDRIRYQELSPIPDQLRRSPRKELDLAILDCLGVENPKLLLDNIYYAVENELSNSS